MHIRLPKAVLHATGAISCQGRSRKLGSDRHSIDATSSLNGDVPKGHFPVYVGDHENQKTNRFVVPITYLSHPLFQELLKKAEEEFGFDPPMGTLTLPCSQHDFLHLITTSHLTS